jgi:hypothetical protein
MACMTASCLIRSLVGLSRGHSKGYRETSPTYIKRNGRHVYALDKLGTSAAALAVSVLLISELSLSESVTKARIAVRANKTYVN